MAVKPKKKAAIPSKAIVASPKVAVMFAQALEHHRAGRLAEADALYQQILAIDPRHSDSLHLSGMVAYAAGSLVKALELIESAVKLQPKADIYLGNYGNVLRAAGRLEEAIVVYRRAIAINPKNPTPFSNLGNAYSDQGMLQEAIEQYEKALLLKPDFYETLFNLGLTLRAVCRFDEAIACLKKATALFPHLAEAHYTLGQLLLLHGDLAEGWVEYDWRWKLDEYKWLKDIHGEFSQPRWEGESLTGKTLLVYAEQGMGDALQFVRYIPRLVERGAKVVFAVHPRLMRVIGAMADVQLVGLDSVPLPPFDYHSPLLSLPRVLGTLSVDDIPDTLAYLKAEPERVARWREKLAATPGFKIGIAWQGNPNAKIDKGRSPPLAEFAPLAAIPGVTLVSLQQRDGLDQLDRLPPTIKVTTLGPGVDDEGAFVDTAAVMDCLDLLIVSDSAIAHLAGGLGRPVWIPLKRVPDWRFLLDRPDTPWYPTMRLFRQASEGDWGGVFKAMAGELASMLGAVPAVTEGNPRGTPTFEPNRPSKTSTDMPLVPQSWGEIIDKITILEIKTEKLTDPAKLKNVTRELTELVQVRESHFPSHSGLAALAAKLKKVNESLWWIEDDIRDCERAKDFGPKFIELARAVYVTNDQRGSVKREINDLLGSALVEEKSYAAYVDDLEGASAALTASAKTRESSASEKSPVPDVPVPAAPVSPYQIGVITSSAQGVFATDLEDQFVGRSLREQGVYAQGEIDLAAKFVGINDSVLVVGAHVGAVAVSMAKQIASVTAFEANPDTFKLLSCNKILNGLDNLEIHNLAASDKTERLRFVLNRHNSGGSKRYPIQPHPAYFHDNPKVVEVDAVALDQFLPNKTYSLVFMDIEGSEYFALKGMSTLLSRTKTLFVEFIPHHLQNVAAISPEEFGATLEPYFEYLYVPGLNSYVDRRNFGVLLRRMYDINLAQEQIVFTNSQGLSVIQTEIRRFTK